MALWLPRRQFNGAYLLSTEPSKINQACSAISLCDQCRQMSLDCHQLEVMLGLFWDLHRYKATRQELQAPIVYTTLIFGAVRLMFLG